jgi:hypothetical protein
VSPPGEPPAEHAGMSSADNDAVEDMADFFRIAREEAKLLFQVGRALSRSAPTLQAEVGAR